MTHAAARRSPDFFIVGAPRCGTTSLYQYLRQHPQIFMPDRKEPCYLCPDLDSGSIGDAIQFIRDPERYFSLFEGVPRGVLAGEACAVYLYSNEAPHRISQLSPAARILVMLRDPVEQVYSHHAIRRAGHHEDLEFADALAAEGERSAGRGLPARPRMLAMYRYLWAARYTDHLARYLDHFGRDRVRVMLLEEFSIAPGRLYRETLEFLGVDNSFRPPFEVANANREVRAPRVMDAIRSPRLILAARRLVPGRLRARATRLAALALEAGMREVERPPMDTALRQRLTEDLRPDVARLSELLDRDLTEFWPAYA